MCSTFAYIKSLNDFPLDVESISYQSVFDQIQTRANMMKVDANKKLVLRWFFGEVRLRPPTSRTPARATRRRDGTLRSLDRVPVPRGDVR